MNYSPARTLVPHAPTPLSYIPQKWETSLALSHRRNPLKTRGLPRARRNVAVRAMGEDREICALREVRTNG